MLVYLSVKWGTSWDWGADSVRGHCVEGLSTEPSNILGAQLWHLWLNYGGDVHSWQTGGEGAKEEGTNEIV